MELKPLPFGSGLDRYDSQVEQLLAAYRAGDAAAVTAFKRHPLFHDPQIKWLSSNPSDEEVLGAGLGLDDARLAVARLHVFRDWLALVEYALAVTREGSPVARFEAAVEAVVDGGAGSGGWGRGGGRGWRGAGRRSLRCGATPPRGCGRGRRASRPTPRRCTVRRCCTTSPPTASRATASGRRRMRWTSRGCCWTRGRKSTRWRTCTGRDARR